MAWLKSHTVILRHRKNRDLARGLRIRPAHSMGHLHALWHAALEQQEDGDLSSWSDEFIADASDYPGDAPQYVRLLQQTGWLDAKLLHDWLDYAGEYLINKYSSHNKLRLVEIWKKHGRVYGDKKGSRERPDGDKNPTTDKTRQDQTIPPQPPKGGRGRGGASRLTPEERQEATKRRTLEELSELGRTA